MPVPKSSLFITLLAAALMPLSIHSSAEDSAARAVLDEAAAAVENMNSFRVETSIAYVGKYNDSEESRTTDLAISVNRDGHLVLHVENDSIDLFVYADDANVTRYMPPFEQYITTAREESVATLVQKASFEIIDPAVGVLVALADFKLPTHGQVVRDLALVGREDVDGIACDRIRYSLGGRTYDVWIEKAPARLIRRIEPDMSQEEERLKQEYQMTFDITLAASLPVWEVNPDIGPAVRFTPPDGAEEVKRFGPRAPAEKLAGTLAPDFTLPLLDGGEFTLSQERGHVVILDFWATWCGPCRVAMPALSEVSKEFKDRGVKLYSIDLEEEPAEIKAFLGQMNLDVTVALDRQSRVAELYKVDGIPQTVIVGPDGVIAGVHVGLWAMPEMSDGDSQQQQMAKLHAALAASLRDELNEILSASAND